MNRTGTVPQQSLRGIPGGFGGGQQQQQQQSGRAGANRLPNGKLAIPVNNGAGWAFGGIGPMSSGGLQNPVRQLGGNVSFAQSLSGSTPATPLDLSEFPQLSNNAQNPNANQQSMWGGQASRNLGAPVQRSQGNPMPQQQTQQDDLFSPTSRLASSQNSFRFGGGQGNVGQSQQTQPGPVDDFPPLGRNSNGEIGSERGANLMSSLGLGSQGGVAPSAGQTTRSGNGLLNAVTANTRTEEARSPIGTRPQDGRSSMTENDVRQKSTAFREDSLASQSSLADGQGQSSDIRNPLGAIGIDAPTSRPNEGEDDTASSVQDPLAGMAPIDKFGLKGLHTLMNNYPDYHALVTGIDTTNLGLGDLSSETPISEMTYSLFDNAPPRPRIPKHTLPECYKVNNVAPIEAKISGFHEETLLWMFYSCPMDQRQNLAAMELQARGWRFHKNLKIWLAKDDHVQPLQLGDGTEQGYYVIWDVVNWRKERREIVLRYTDLEEAPTQLPAIPPTV